MSSDRPHIEVLLERIQDPKLRDQLASEIANLSGQRKFGLVYETHSPEAIRIPGAPIKRDSTVQFKDGDDQRVWKVVRARAGKATLINLDGDRLDDVPIANLIIARQLGDPVYPGFIPLGTIEKGGDKPHHLVIQGENYHALQTLIYTHRESVDLIYIDPPYNTGAGDWIYNDRYVGDADAYRHSKWLSFMEKRLELARKLLKPTGVIIVAIDDNEHHRLRMLLDQEFGEKNFLANFTWQGITKSDSRFGGGGVDYMLCYGRDVQQLVAADVRWKEPKLGFTEILQAVEKAWRESNHTPDEATKLYRKWLRGSGLQLDKSTKLFDTIDGTGRLYQKVSIGSPSPRPNLMYEIEHPVTGKPVSMPPNGWAVQESKMRERIAADLIVFGPDETTTPRRKSYFDELDSLEPSMVIEQGRSSASGYLTKLLGTKDFPFPKNTEVIAHWINVISAQNKTAVILDFFAGTGTTAEAVMQLNLQDGGRRQSIIVTNNELAKKDSAKLVKAGHQLGDPEWEAHGVFQKVTRPRIETVVTGVRPDGTRLTENSANGVGKPIKGATGYSENVSFLKLEYLTRDSIELGEAFRQVAPILWAKAGSVGPMITEQTDTFAFTDHYGVLFTPDRGSGFDEEVVRRGVHMVFIITDSVEVFGAVRRTIPQEVRAVHLYRNYLTNFEINTRKVN